MDTKSPTCYLVGIKGTGMASLAVLLKRQGRVVRGCDTDEQFSTDVLLREHAIPVDHGFHEDLLPLDTDLVVHSSAYDPTLPILVHAALRGIPVYSYPRYLACLSRLQDSYAVAGTHGKTTTCAVASHLLASVSNRRFPFYTIYGSRQLGGSSDTFFGTDCALFEACEYQDHFLSYRFRGAVVTSIEHDHPDYFPTKDSVIESFKRFVDALEAGGFLIVCSDDAGAKELGRYAKKHRADLTLLSYGFSASGPFQILKGEEGTYRVSILPDYSFALAVHAPALVNDYVGAMLLSLSILLDRPKPNLYCSDEVLITDEVVPTLVGRLGSHLASFKGCSGRTEYLFSENGVTYLDDYAHHPTEIMTSLEEVRSAYPGHRVLVLFCPHTASRTKALIDRFAAAFDGCDAVIVQKTYASARNDQAEGTDPARDLAVRLQGRDGCPVAYCDTDQACISQAASWLQENWLCITMGAGNNRHLCREIAAFQRSF
ncbi:MAG: UDP-N-acetylmuramate--L-alanine ligase [Sphaerochaeta sp.]|jgi:UDP-N-acetylmuramate--alanine ligase|uniref:UDP-N-acetylmuramate--L-alanine ligase n=1 Tax=Sphaerochaeta sp. TaxID=1972642 RepID=UPI003D10199C